MTIDDVRIDLGEQDFVKNDPDEINNLLGSNPDRFKYVERVENLRSKLLTYLIDVNYPLVEGIQQRVLIRK